ncbi:MULTISPECIES: Fur-regulated basic protein FbpA [Bacillaceae]|uniref:Fur-regulated basic protein FbpA n=1 Tax=Evansella alkalicola TaxID=745819 RepID=A0ABS6JWE4_9BACI|nr:MULTISPECIES: Fur-regulated basic protein FbpA [Bacillaceae]MBU9722884.1 Fur-regulated basic protein FbpA [Bacillus alkalicola]
MSKHFREAIKMKKNYLINQLIKLGIYKKRDTHLYELTLSELEEEYEAITKADFTSVG